MTRQNYVLSVIASLSNVYNIPNNSYQNPSTHNSQVLDVTKLCF
jgi:hypothetical protein